MVQRTVRQSVQASRLFPALPDGLSQQSPQNAFLLSWPLRNCCCFWPTLCSPQDSMVGCSPKPCWRRSQGLELREPSSRSVAERNCSPDSMIPAGAQALLRFLIYASSAPQTSLPPRSPAPQLRQPPSCLSLTCFPALSGNQTCRTKRAFRDVSRLFLGRKPAAHCSGR